jgi:hypothetical protein
LEYSVNHSSTLLSKINKTKSIKLLKSQLKSQNELFLPSIIEEFDSKIETDFLLNKTSSFLISQYGHLLEKNNSFY